MAREYGRIYTAFWNSAAIRGLSDRAKLLGAYLLSGPHSNSIGAYLLPDAYIADDLGWDGRAVATALKELLTAAFCERFNDGRHIAICKFLEWNPIENPNVGKAALKQLEQLPVDPAARHVINGLHSCRQRFPDGFETALERFRNIEIEMEIEPEIEPKPKMDLARSANADDATAALQAYNLVAQDLNWPQAARLTVTRRSKLSQRLKECGGLDGWRVAMGKAHASPWLRGETRRGKGFENWTPDLDFFLQQASFTKLMEGKYDERNNPNQQPTGFDAVLAAAMAVANQ